MIKEEDSDNFLQYRKERLSLDSYFETLSYITYAIKCPRTQTTANITDKILKRNFQQKLVSGLRIGDSPKSKRGVRFHNRAPRCDFLESSTFTSKSEILLNH